jgi:hypothetical protein
VMRQPGLGAQRCGERAKCDQSKEKRLHVAHQGSCPFR